MNLYWKNMGSRDKWNPFEALEQELYEVVMKDGKKVMVVRGYVYYVKNSWTPYKQANYEGFQLPLDHEFKPGELSNLRFEKALQADMWVRELGETEAAKYLEENYGPKADVTVLPYDELSPETPLGTYITGRTGKYRV